MKPFILLFFLTFVFSVYSQETLSEEGSGSGLDRKKNFYVQLGKAEWKSGSLGNMYSVQRSRAVNTLLALPFDSSSFPVHGGTPSYLDAKALTFGIRLGSSARHRANLMLRYVTTDDLKYSTAAREQANIDLLFLRVQSFENRIEMTKANPLKRGLFQYDHDIYLLPDHPSKFLQGLGIKVGFALQGDNVKGNTTPYGNVSSVTAPSLFSFSSGSTSTNSFIYPIPGKFDQTDYSGYVILGLSYRLALAKNQELDFSYSILNGKANGSSVQTSYALFNGNLPYQVGTKTTYEGAVTGNAVNLGYSYFFNEKFFVRAGYETRDLSYKLEHLKTKAVSGTSSPYKDYGPYPTYKDSIKYYTVEFAYRF